MKDRQIISATQKGQNSINKGEATAQNIEVKLSAANIRT